MKLSFVITLLASMAILSLSAPVLSNDEAMLEALSATLEAETHNSAPAQADASLDVETSETSTIAVRTITITSTRADWMSFSWVACFDQSGTCFFASWRCEMKCVRGCLRPDAIWSQARTCALASPPLFSTPTQRPGEILKPL